MMRLKLIMALTIMFLFPLTLGLRPAVTKTSSSIVVAGADSSWLMPMIQSSGLAGVAQSVSPRVISGYADATLQQPLFGVPSALSESLRVVTARVIAGHNDAGYVTRLSYPRALINDIAVPVIDTFANTIAGTNAKITWNTNEFARCTVRYGTQPGNYTNTIENLLHFKQHEATLPAITIGAIYYVQLVCTDQSDNAATSAEFSFGTDKIAPVISEANPIVSGTSVSITWQTDEPATTQVRYGPAPGNYPQNAESPGFSTAHTVVLAGLADGKYYAQIISVDQSGNQAVSTEFSFVIDTTAPQISAITEPVLTGNNARLGWTTNEVATARIEFGTQAGVYTGFVNDPAGTGPQQFTLPGLAWGTTYFVRIRADDGHGNVTTSIEFSFTTPQAVFLPLIRR